MPFQPDYDVPEDRRAYSLPAGNVGCLMLHGFMGSPKSNRPMGEFLHAHTVSVHAPLLPGHGYFPEKLYKVSRRSWVAEADDAYQTLQRRCSELFLVGHSMGGVLAAHLSNKHQAVGGIVLIAPPYDVPDPRIRWTSILRYVVPWFKPWKSRSLGKLARERVLDFDPTIDVDDPALQTWLTRKTRVPTGSLDEMQRMLALGRDLWPRVAVPTLIIQGGKDVATSPAGARQVFDALGTRAKELVVFPEAGHELMRPKSAFSTDVWQLIYRFIQRHARHELPSI